MNCKRWNNWSADQLVMVMRYLLLFHYNGRTFTAYYIDVCMRRMYRRQSDYGERKENESCRRGGSTEADMKTWWGSRASSQLRISQFCEQNKFIRKYYILLIEQNSLKLYYLVLILFLLVALNDFWSSKKIIIRLCALGQWCYHHPTLKKLRGPPHAARLKLAPD